LGQFESAVGNEVRAVPHSVKSVTEDAVAFEDGILTLRDGRELAWRSWGEDGGIPILRLQGTPGSRLYRNHNPQVQRDLGVRYLMADRPGYGGSSRKPGRGVADIADDLVELLDIHGLERVPVMGTSGGGPHALAIAALYPDRISAVSVIVGAVPLELDEVSQLVGVNALGYAAAEMGWDALYKVLAPVRERILGAEGMQGVLSDAPATDRAIMESAAWQRMSRINAGEALKQGAEGWTDESFALHRKWDFEPRNIKASVTWWHGDDDKNAPLSAARRGASQLRQVDLRVWHQEGHFASLVHEKEIVQELLDRST
jgi:pimeloyl-ACP methyl ester carboxylesterase